MYVIDISANNEYINFEEVKKDGYGGVIIRCGGSYDGFFKDSKFEDFYNRAKSSGLKVGCYYIPGKDFGKNPAADADADFKYWYEIIKDKSFELPIFIDIELQNPANRKGITDAVIEIGKKFESNGYYFGVYGSEVLGFMDLMEYDRVKRFGLWVACYDKNPPDIDYIMWQYSSKGLVPGCKGYIDKNNLKDGISDAIEKQGLNKCKKKESVKVSRETSKVIEVKAGETITIKGV